MPQYRASAVLCQDPYHGKNQRFHAYSWSPAPHWKASGQWPLFLMQTDCSSSQQPKFPAPCRTRALLESSYRTAHTPVECVRKKRKAFSYNISSWFMQCVRRFHPRIAEHFWSWNQTPVLKKSNGIQISVNCSCYFWCEERYTSSVDGFTHALSSGAGLRTTGTHQRTPFLIIFWITGIW